MTRWSGWKRVPHLEPDEALDERAAATTSMVAAELVTTSARARLPRRVEGERPPAQSAWRSAPPAGRGSRPEGDGGQDRDQRPRRQRPAQLERARRGSPRSTARALDGAHDRAPARRQAASTGSRPSGANDARRARPGPAQRISGRAVREPVRLATWRRRRAQDQPPPQQEPRRSWGPRSSPAPLDQRSPPLCCGNRG